MDIYLTNHANVRNTSFSTADGQTMYRSETPGSLFNPYKTTTIYKIIPNNSLENMADSFTDLATIKWHAFASPKLTYDGAVIPIALKGAFYRHRIFTPPGDERSFKWTLGFWTVTLRLNDGSKTIVARGHRSNVGVIGQPRQARLEILPGFEHFVDIILVTYVYAEKLRKDQEKFGQKRRPAP